MAAQRNYRSGVTAGLLSLCRGSCYWPDCRTPVVVFVEGQPMANLEIAHIAAANAGGPRYNPMMTDSERNSFPNLLLLCRSHHRIIDGPDWRRYPAAVLLQWKAARENAGLAALAGLGRMTEERLQEMITAAIETRDRQVAEALVRFERADSAAAAILRDLVGQLGDAGLVGRHLDPDMVSMLDRASRALQHSVNEDVVARLAGAARDLENLPQTVEMLSHAVTEIRRSQRYM